MKKILLLLVITLTAFGCDLGSDTSDKSDKKDAGNTTEPVLYDIVFDGNGGKGSMGLLSKEEGKSITLPKNTFTKENHLFTGWATNADGSGAMYDDASILVVGTSNITLYAQWRDLRFISKWEVFDRGGLSTPTLQFPLNNSGDYDFVIDWGDGTIDTVKGIIGTANYIEHTYPDYGQYIVTVTGKCIGFGHDRERNTSTATSHWIYELQDVLNWGNVQFHNEGYVFYGTRGFTTFSAKDTPDLSNLTSLQSMFRDSTFNGDLSNWNTSTITDMESTFLNSDFNGDISGWNVSNVTSMFQMFFQSKFNGDIPNWNVGKVISMFRMFSSSSFNGDISGWNVTSVYSMARMFEHSPFNGDISKWVTTNVRYMDYMFYYAAEFNCGNIVTSTWNWDVANVANNEDMFKGSKLQGIEPGWYVSTVQGP